MTHTTFTISNNNSCKNATNNCTFCNKPNYSKILDSIILSNIMKSNKYLTEKQDSSILDSLLADAKKKSCPFANTCSLLKGDDEFTKAANFLANYKKTKAPANLPFTLGKCYKLSTGETIIFYDDEFQIDCDIYHYDDFANMSFLKSLAPAKKNIIINIFGASNINININ